MLQCPTVYIMPVVMPALSADDVMLTVSGLQCAIDIDFHDVRLNCCVSESGLQVVERRTGQ